MASKLEGHYRSLLQEAGFHLAWQWGANGAFRERHELPAGEDGRIWVFLDIQPNELAWSIGYDSPGASDLVAVSGACDFTTALVALLKKPAHRTVQEPQ